MKSHISRGEVRKALFTDAVLELAVETAHGIQEGGLNCLLHPGEVIEDGAA